jgi:hypothetical protein
MRLAILIPTLKNRVHLYKRCYDLLMEQIKEHDLTDHVSILTYQDNGENKIGFKRNKLLQRSDAEYISFFDDDDIPGPSYIETFIELYRSGLDCARLNGIITENDLNPKDFIHSIKYNSWFEKDGIYYRPPNHLNFIKGEIASRIQFPEKNFGEDHEWSTSLLNSGLIKTEFDHEKLLYYYLYRTK